MKQLKIGFAGSSQTNFGGGAAGGKEKLFCDSADELRLLAKEMDFSLYVYPGTMVTGEDAARAKAVFEKEHVDFLLIQTTTFSAGEVILELAKINAALGIWALPEPSAKGSIFINSINSFCGLNMFGGIIYSYLKDYDIKYKWFYGNPRDELFLKRFRITVRALAAIKQMRRSKVALVGGIAPGFNDLYSDERLAQKRLGVTINRGHEFSEIKQRAAAYSSEELESVQTEALGGYGNTAEASQGNLDIHIRYYKAYSDFCREYGYDAIAVSCWPKMQDELDGLSCSVVGKLNQNGIPAACEGDLPGAVSMLMQKYLAEYPPTLMDLSGLNEEDQTVLLWHCGPAPECYTCENGASLKYSVQPAGTEETKTIGLISDMVFSAQPVTVMRFTGEWDSMFLLDGHVVPEQKDSPEGSRGWVGGLRLNRRSITVRDLINTILVKGFQHHYPLVTGDITEELMEVAAWLGLKPLEAVAYENYLQIKR